MDTARGKRNAGWGEFRVFQRLGRAYVGLQSAVDEVESKGVSMCNR